MGRVISKHIPGGTAARPVDFRTSRRPGHGTRVPRLERTDFLPFKLMSDCRGEDPGPPAVRRRFDPHPGRSHGFPQAGVKDVIRGISLRRAAAWGQTISPCRRWGGSLRQARPARSARPRLRQSTSPCRATFMEGDGERSAADFNRPGDAGLAGGAFSTAGRRAPGRGGAAHPLGRPALARRERQVARFSQQGIRGPNTVKGRWTAATGTKTGCMKRFPPTLLPATVSAPPSPDVDSRRARGELIVHLEGFEGRLGPWLGSCPRPEGRSCAGISIGGRLGGPVT